MSDDPIGDLAQASADYWRPIAGASHPAADPVFMREVIEANLDGMAERLRPQVEALMASIPWPVRLLARAMACLRRH
jgi:hypothetical protein